MVRDRFKWHLTFKYQPVTEITLDEDHSELSFLKSQESCFLVSATLIDVDKFSIFTDEDTMLSAVIHNVQFTPSKLIRVFRRVELDVVAGIKRVIPAIQYQSDNKDHYCFAFPDKVVLTDDSRYFRSDWGHTDD